MRLCGDIVDSKRNAQLRAIEESAGLQGDANGHALALQPLILIAEDEPEIGDILEAYLVRSHMRVIHARDGVQALQMHSMHKPDLVILDVHMPRKDGWQVLAEIRAHSLTPVIMLTALDQDMDKLMGLRMGADDYVVKPFNPPEVVARVQAVLRRLQAPQTQEAHRILRVGGLAIDTEYHEVTVEAASTPTVLALTHTELKLLAHLARTPRRVFTRLELLNACLPESDSLERTVDSHLSKLRKKLEDAGVQGIPCGVRGVGYKFKATP